jgi:DNA helicase-2/ATP-dependent DNA helicase PcrA
MVEALATENIAAIDETPPRPEILRTDDAPQAPDPLFDTGWAGAIRDAGSGRTAIDGLASSLGIADEVESEVARLTDRLFNLDDLAMPAESDAGGVISVTGLVTYAQCPKRFYWSEVDPLPRKRNFAAVAGTELHRRIELYLRGQVPFEEMTESLYDVPDEAADVAGASGFAAFEASRFAQHEALMIEAPFEMALSDSMRVRGRIDAVYSRGNHWEVVDFKSGRPKTEPARLVQLEAYAVACRDGDFGHPRPATLDVTFAYLGGGLTEETFPATDEWVGQATTHLDTLVSGIEAGRFETTPGPWCSHCDFLPFCEAGQAEVDGSA